MTHRERRFRPIHRIGFVISHCTLDGNESRTRLTQVAVVLALFSVHARIVRSADAPWAGKATYIPKLEKNLKENITAIWLSKKPSTAQWWVHRRLRSEGRAEGAWNKNDRDPSPNAVAFSHRLVRAGYGGRNIWRLPNVAMAF